MNVVQNVIRMARERGFSFVVVAGQPVLRGDSSMMTEPLRRALAEFRPQIIEHLKLDVTKPSPATEPDFARSVNVMDAFGQIGVVVNCTEWKTGSVAWRYIGEKGWRPIVGREEMFPPGVPHA